MAKIKGLVIPADRRDPPYEWMFESTDTDAVQDIVGGTFDAMDADPEPYTFWAKDGAAPGLRSNAWASALLWSIDVDLVGQRYLAGDVLLAGRRDSMGAPTAVPEQIVELVAHNTVLTVEFKTRNDAWIETSARFMSYWTATDFAFDLISRWRLIVDFRIVGT